MAVDPEVLVTFPLRISSEMIEAVRNDPLCKVDDLASWHERLGWLVCAYDAMVSARTNAAGRPRSDHGS